MKVTLQINDVFNYMGSKWTIIELTDNNSAILEIEKPIPGVSKTKEIKIKDLLNAYISEIK